ncbi:ABC transporter permease [Nocardiopsis dassonvillei]|uniref:ABC transporter permease n=1 Tax=Nocardiopsis dassonvillei TaxID=2014 RepID=UPI003670ED54
MRMVLRGAADRARQLALSVLTVALGAGLATAVLALQDSAERVAAGGAGASWTLSRAPVVVAAVPEEAAAGITASPLGEPPRLDPETVAELERLPGVRRTAVEAPFSAYVVTSDRTLGGHSDRSFGHSWALAEAEGLTPATGRAPESGNEVVIDTRTAADAGLAPGDRARVLTSDGIAQVLVTGTVERGGAPDRALFFPPAEAARRGGEPVMAALWPGEGTGPDRLAGAVEEAAPGVRVLTGDERSTALALDGENRDLASGMGRFLGTMAALALAVAAVTVAGLLSLTVRDRAREFALLRLAGARPGLVRRLVVGEALVLGCVAAALSCVVGTALALLLAWLFTELGTLPDGFALVLGWPALAAGAALALAVPLAASLRPALTAGRIAPVEAMRAAQAEPVPFSRARLVLGAVVLCGAVALFATGWGLAGTVVAVTAAASAALVLVAAAVLLSPVLVHAVLLLLRPVTRRRAASLVADREARADVRRVAGVMTPLLVTTAVACLLLFQETTTTEARLRAYGERLAADLVVSGAPGVGLPASAAETAEDVPGVAVAGGYRQTVTSAGGPYLTTHLVEPETVPRIYDLMVEDGAWEDFGTGGVAVRADTARSQGWRAGRTVELLGPDGTGFTARVSVLYRAGLDFPDVLLPEEAVAPRMLDTLHNGLYVALDPSADAGRTASLVEEAIDAGPELRVADRAEHIADQARIGQEDAWITHLMVALVAGFAGVSAVNALVVSVSARARSFALLRLVGASRAQVAGMVAGEALAVSLAGVALGTATALTGVAAVGHALVGGGTVVLAVPLDQYLPLAGAVVGIGLLASLVPAVAALRARPLHAAG